MKNNIPVKSAFVDNVAETNARYQVPPSLKSCHTTIINGYLVEWLLCQGPRPIRAVAKIVKEKPPHCWHRVASMPAGLPGMPGAKLESFKIYTLARDETQRFSQPSKNYPPRATRAF